MPAALVGTASCARCGSPSTGDAACPQCGTVLLPAADGAVLGSYGGLLSGAVPATALRRRVAAAVDGTILAIPLAIGITAIVIGLPSLAIGGFVAAAVIAGIQAILLERRGRSIGRLLFGLRIVDDLSGTPLRGALALVRLLVLGWSRGAFTADLRAGRDPLVTAHDPLPASGLGAALASRTGRRRAGRTAAAAEHAVREPVAPATPVDRVTLVLDSGVRLEVSGRLLVGRNPAAPDGEEQARYAWPDLSRSLSKTHALLEWAGTVLWVTDLHSTNGTRLISPDGSVQPLVPEIPGPAGPGWTVEFGDRRLEVHAGAER